MKRNIAAILVLAALASGCATAPSAAPVEVMRYHLDPPLETGSIVVQPATGAAGLEFEAYAGAIRDELAANGFPAAPTGDPGQFYASVSLLQREQEGPRRDSGVSVGIGAGGYSGGYRGGGVGLGGGISFPIGKRKPTRLVQSELAVQILRRADRTVIWEGRARTSAVTTGPTIDQAAIGARLAHALFAGFPGESGRTIEVK